MTTYLTETKETYKAETGHKLDGKEILTVTLWADGEKIQSFGGSIYDDAAEVRAKAAAAANEWDGTTGDEIRAYDAFIRRLD